MIKKSKKINNGFTLIGIIVAISLFTFVMFISTGSILSIFDTNRKSRNTRAVMDNLNYTVEAMTRTIRFGKNYHCDVTITPVSSPRDCSSGATSIAVTDSSGVQIIYRFNGGSLERSVAGGSYVVLTSSDVTLSSKSSFRVFGSAPYDASGSTHDLYQPQVIIVIDGSAGSKTFSRSNFTLMTSVSQRVIDSQ